MDSFEDLGLAPELVEALAAEGIERPTPLQESAIPVVRRGNSLIMAAGPGSGVMVSWAAGLLDHLSPEAEGPVAVVLSESTDRVEQLAVSLGRLAGATGHQVAAIGGRWAFPERAHLVCATPQGLMSAVQGGKLSLDGVTACVVDDASRIETSSGLDSVVRILEYLPRDAQKVVTALPITDGVAAFVDAHIQRAITIPGAIDEDAPRRGHVRFRVASEPREDAVLSVVADLFADSARHVLVYCRSEDRAADVGDLLTLHGFTAGAPGDRNVPVWLGVDALEARAEIADAEGVMVVSCDAPTDPDMLDRRHSLTGEGVVVTLVREIAHLRDLARRTGYTVAPWPPAEDGTRDAGAPIRAMLRKAMEEEDTAPYLLALEELFKEFDAIEVAAAAVALLRKKGGAGIPGGVSAPTKSRGGVQPYVKLFFGVGERDDLTPGDLLGAITGEAGVDGDAVGRIEIRESHTLVEVHDHVAPQIIRALNGTTIRGRAVRADFDRPKRPAARPRTRGGRTP